MIQHQILFLADMKEGEQVETPLKESKVTKEQVFAEGKWLGMKYVSFSIGDKIVDNYQAVYRTTTKNKGFGIDGVEVIPVIKYAERSPQLVMIANFRPPVNSFTLEFPSGLIEDEDFQENAKRETLEETGYTVKQFVKLPSPKMYSDPWKSNQCGLLYIGIIDGDDPSSLPQSQKLDNQENIRVHKVTLDKNLHETINNLITKHNYVVEAKVWAICTGMVLNQFIK